MYICSFFPVPKALYVYTLCKARAIVPMLVIILFLLVLHSSAIIRKQSVGSKTCCYRARKGIQINQRNCVPEGLS